MGSLDLLVGEFLVVFFFLVVCFLVLCVCFGLVWFFFNERPYF